MSLVSVIVPTYKRPELLKRCYASVVAQQHRPLEFVITDDASGDETPEVVASLPAAEGIRIRFLQQKLNQGVSAARNTSIRNSSGEHLAFLDSDDVWLPSHLASLVPFLEKKHADVVYSQGDMRSSPDLPTCGHVYGPTELEERELSRCLYLSNPVLPSVTVMTRKAFERVGFFDETPEIQHAEDWDLFLRCAETNLRFQHVRKVTGIYVVPRQMPLPKRVMMTNRGLYCLEKHNGYPYSPPREKRMSRKYYLLYLLAILHPQQKQQSGVLFRRLIHLGMTDPLLMAAGILGQVSCSLSFPSLDAVASRINQRLLRKIRVIHRQRRGLTDVDA